MSGSRRGALSGNGFPRRPIFWTKGIGPSSPDSDSARYEQPEVDDLADLLVDQTQRFSVLNGHGVLRHRPRSMLQAAGYSYREIGQRRGWTYTKVNRALATARATLRELAVA